MSDETVALFQAEREERLVRGNLSKAKWSADRLKAQAERVESERIDAIAAKITHTIAALFFLENSIAVLQRDYDSLCKYADGSTWIDPRLLEGLNAAKRQRDEFTQYLAEQSKAGTPFTAEDIQKETERFAYGQGAPERLAKAASNAAKKIEEDAKPQPIPGGPLVTYDCPKCGGGMPSAGVALHHGPNGWCVINTRKAYASGRDAYWLLSEGGCTVQDLLAAGIAVPQL
jgi:hypothetical protein